MFPLLLSLCLTSAGDDAMVRLLGSEDFRTRVAADGRLRERGWHARAALARGSNDPDPEVRSRATVLYEQALSAEIGRYEPLPEIDSAWYDAWPKWWTGRFPGYRHDVPGWKGRWERMNPYLERVGKDGWPWHNYYQATRDWLRDEIEAGATPEDLTPLLDEMRLRDAVFLRRYNGMEGVP